MRSVSISLRVGCSTKVRQKKGNKKIPAPKKHGRCTIRPEMLTAPPRVRRRFQGAGGFGLLSSRLRTGARIAVGSFGPLCVRFCVRFSARFSANMRTREQGRTSFVRVFASLPGRKDRTAASAAAYSYLLVAKGSTKTIRMSLSREPPPARVERAQ